MPDKAPHAPVNTDFAGPLKWIKTPLSIFGLALLVVNAVLGAAMVGAHDNARMILAALMVVSILAVVGMVAILVRKDPGALMLTSDSDRGENRRVEAVRRQVAGAWWEWVDGTSSVRISYVEVVPTSTTQVVSLNGRSFGEDGSLTATWSSVACCVDPETETLFYYWRGRRIPGSPGDDYAGFGELRLGGDTGAQTADGFFADVPLRELSNTTCKEVQWRRASAEDVRVMHGGDTAKLKELVIARIASH